MELNVPKEASSFSTGRKISQWIMAAPIREKTEKPQRTLFRHIVVGVGITAAAYPLSYCKVLVQIGHEPIPPVVKTSLFGRKNLVLPNVFKYMKHIKDADGLFGLYRGLSFKIMTGVISTATAHHVLEGLHRVSKKQTSIYKDIDDGDTKKQSLDQFLLETKNQMAAQVAAIVVSQPFHVMSIRCMAQFVGKEDAYSGFFSSISEIWKNDGILGFFAGLVPRLFGEILIIICANTITFAINTYMFESDVKQYCGPMANLLVGAVLYPFNVVSSVMTVTNSGLAAGSPPHMPHYDGWRDCWKQLSREHALKRGSSMLFRYYTGPVVYRGTIPVPAVRDVLTSSGGIKD